jgi:glycerol-1-phosphate dehydrogenase [NAD(P)+]
MPLLARMLTTPLQVEVSHGAIGGLGNILSDCRISRDGRVAVVVGAGMGEHVVRALDGFVEPHHITIVESGSVEEAIDLATRLNSEVVDAVVGIGGGRTLDVTKFAATRLGLPMVAVATSLAHDGIASPVSVLQHGEFRRSYGVAAPAAVVVDLDFVLRAPAHFLRSGIGDVVSNISAIADWRLAHRVLGEPIDGIAVALASTAAEAVVAQSGPTTETAFMVCLAESLILSGMAMSAAGTSRPCSGACHEISHAMDMHFPGIASHGEQVGLGALFATFMRGDVERVTQLVGVFRRYGLAVTPLELGVKPDEFVQAVLRGPATRPDRFTVLEHLALDEAGTRRTFEAYMEFVE